MLCLVQTGCRIWRRRRSCWGDKGVCKNSYKREFGLCRTSLYLGAQSLPSTQVLFHSAHVIGLLPSICFCTAHFIGPLDVNVHAFQIKYQKHKSHNQFSSIVFRKRKSHFRSCFFLLFCLPLATPLSFFLIPSLSPQVVVCFLGSNLIWTS